MRSRPTYFDSAYVAKFYLEEHGHSEVRALAREAGRVSSSWLAYAEVMAGFRRYLRGRGFDREAAVAFASQFERDLQLGLWDLLPITQDLLLAVGKAYHTLKPNTFLRSADAIHLVTAREHGFQAVHSNDLHLLKAAAELRIKGINVIP